ncbi:hypothetical protein C9374_000341 [Naegleria lovaniensis]|uniref:Ras family small GTPase n=1 Tax=Naegleria lovaniensis TaxID=51637 RepID=A0AA88KTZ2_NAELO|nr:uncharacterized protein C9374_000341 [Naegleria lovaniensis]KAG2388902.1 hypothetical protein C9374_000341 [Naegleria lovaniensis]
MTRQQGEYDLAVLGTCGSGKLALTFQYTSFLEEQFPDNKYSLRKYVKIDDEPYFLDFLDNTGNEEYRALLDQTMRCGSGFLLVYRVSDRNTFEPMNDLYEQILVKKDAEKVPMVLVGNRFKMESERQVTFEEGKRFARDINIPFFEVETTEDIIQAFTTLVCEIRKTKPNHIPIQIPQKKSCELL